MPPTRKSVSCGRFRPPAGGTRYFPRAGKYPKGAGGGQRVHGTWPPPDPPLLSYSAPLASQGRAQRGSHPFPGGPLSPSAQSIPPPAPRRRSILGVSARGRHDSAPRRRNVPLALGQRKICCKTKLFLPVLPNFCGGNRFFNTVGESLQTIQGILRKPTLTALGTHSMMERITKGEIHPPWGGSMGAGAPKEDEKR